MAVKPQKTKEKDVDALTFMQTVIMSFVGGMEYGEQTLPTNDLFVYLPVQILPDLVVAMERQGFTPAQVKGGYGHRWLSIAYGFRRDQRKLARKFSLIVLRSKKWSSRQSSVT